jgi:hypothetical protein
VLECESSQKQAAEAMTALLGQNPTITAVVCYNNLGHIGERRQRHPLLEVAVDAIFPALPSSPQQTDAGGVDAAAAGGGRGRDAKPDHAPAAGDEKMTETPSRAPG